LNRTHLSRPEHGFTTSDFGIRFLNPLRIKFECTYLAERVVFDRMNPKPAMSQLLACLHSGGIVSIMASMHKGGTLVDLPFLAGRLKFSLGALRLARLSGAAVIPVFVLRDRKHVDSFEVIFDTPLAMPKGLRCADDLRAAACEYRDRLETVVGDRPESWVGWRRADQLS
jgi:lauroyl/myristoyl acyltransferase